MRLTLRTLLSYLDNVLDEPSRAELQRQIDGSEHASEWIYRTRDVTRRLKLGAPEPEGTCSVDDPNTVAEYLDRTLPEESVAEFERVCLESDAMLAEVASCHHVLAMFLSEPTDIDPDTRRRLHRLQDDLAKALKLKIEAAHKMSSAAAAAAAPAPPQPAAEEPPLARRVKALAPGAAVDAPRRSDWVQWAPAIAASLLLAVVAILTFGTGGREADESGAVADANGADTKGAAAEETEETAEKPAVVTPTPSDEGAEQEAAASQDAAPEGAADDPAEAAATTPPQPAAETSSTETETASPTEPRPVAEAPGDGAPGDGAPDAAAPAASTEDPAGDAAAGMEEDAAPPAVETPPMAEPEAPGTMLYKGAPTEFAVFEIKTGGGAWERLVAGLETGDAAHVVCLPTYRTAFELSTGVLVELVGATDATIDPSSPGLDLAYGRVVLTSLPAATEPVEIEITIDGVDYAATLAPGARLAIAADHFFDPGWPVREASPATVIVAHALGGEVTWTSTGGSQSFTEPKATFFVENIGQAPPSFTDRGWIEGLDVPVTDQQASPRIADSVRGADVVSQLLTLVMPEGFAEDRSLAARCSLVLGDPDALVESFKDELLEAYWPRHWAALRQAASRSPEMADRINAAFAGAYGRATGAEFFHLLEGLTVDQIGSTPEAVSIGFVPTVLVPMLESNDLATRVLANFALEEAVGPVNPAFEPTGRRSDQRTSLRLLKRDLDRGDIEPRLP